MDVAELYLRRLRFSSAGKINSRSPSLRYRWPEFQQGDDTGTMEKSYPTSTFRISSHLADDHQLLSGRRADSDPRRVQPPAERGVASGHRLRPLQLRRNRPRSSQGRADTGMQIRGLLAGKHVEYRMGLFQGLREERPQPVPLRRPAALVAYPTENGSSTPHKPGKKHSFSLGRLQTCRRFPELPRRSLHGSAAWDEAEPDLPGRSLPVRRPAVPAFGRRADRLHVEAGLSVLSNRLTPYVQVARMELDKSAVDETASKPGWPGGGRASRHLQTGVGPGRPGRFSQPGPVHVAVSGVSVLSECHTSTEAACG